MWLAKTGRERIDYRIGRYAQWPLRLGCEIQMEVRSIRTRCRPGELDVVEVFVAVVLG
jgi:hypothetical protein